MSDEDAAKAGGDTLHFSVDSHLLLELGERLVARKSIALAELVKNSYDADATKVTIRLLDVTGPAGSITVVDNGNGMTFESVMSGWMRIATVDKLENPLSPRYRRPRTGQKGVGRFACRLLADTLTIKSVAQKSDGSTELVTVSIDWRSFAPGTPVEVVPVSYSRTGVDRNTPTGTTLVLDRVRASWTAQDVLEARKDLLSLVSPFGIRTAPSGDESDPGFDIVLETPEFEDVGGLLSEQIMKHAWARLEGELLEDGAAKYTATLKTPKKTSSLIPESTFPETGRLKVVINFFVWKRDYLGDLAISVKDAQKLGNDQGGIRIYLDGFRIFPYGEPGDDWLNLDADRGRRIQTFRFLDTVDKDLERPGLFLPGNNQLFGAVFLSRNQNPRLQPTITRDRLVSNEAFDGLQRFVRLGVEWLTVLYARERAKTAKREREERTRADPVRPLEEAIDEVRQMEPDLGPGLVAELVHSLELARDAVVQREEQRINELSMLRVLATTGAMVSILDHELQFMIDRLRAISREMRELSRGMQGEAAGKIWARAHEVQEWTDTIEQYGLQLAVLLGPEARDRRRIMPLRPLVDDMARPFARHLKEIGARFENEVPPELRLPAMYQCEIHSVFLNLLTNSMKAVRRTTERKITIQARRVGSKIRILFLDTGPGVSAERRDEVFHPFESDSEPDPILGTGTGLGLKIVRDIVDTYGGEVHFIDPPVGWGACVEIVLSSG